MSTGAQTNAELEALIARTSLKYDLVPYTSNPFPQTHPGRLGALARIFGIDAAPIETARILELGCAAGGNIIPHAARYPGCRVLGVDLSRQQVAAGRGRIERLALTNIAIECKSFTELEAKDEGSFDYIVCHGVYSWIPGPVREALLGICRRMLSPKGVAIISYNVLPGWRLLQAIRDSFIVHAGLGGGREPVARGLELLALMKEWPRENGAYKQLIDAWADRLAQMPVDYVAHEFIEDINEPCTFQDFVAAAGRHRLAYLADADLPSMILDNHRPEQAAKLRELGRNQQIATEQYMDIMTGRTFRQTLLIGAERAAAVDRNLSPSRIAGLHLFTGGDLKVVRAENGGSLTDAAGRRLTTTSGAVLDALAEAVGRYPATTSIDELAARQVGETRAMALDAIYRMVLAGLAVLTSTPIAATSAPGETPTACPLARRDAEAGDQFVTNLRHERTGLDPLAQLLLPMLDGSRSRAELVRAVTAALADGRLVFSREGKPITAPDEIERLAPEQLTASLAAIARVGLLVA